MAFKISRHEKIVARPSGNPKLFTSKVTKNLVPKSQPSFIPYSKVIDLTNYKLNILNYQLKFTNSFGNVMVF